MDSTSVATLTSETPSPAKTLTLTPQVSPRARPPAPPQSATSTSPERRFVGLLRQFSATKSTQEARGFNYSGLNPEEKVKFFQIMTGRLCQTKGGMLAYARDYWPVPVVENFLFAPQASQYPGDTTWNVKNQAGLGSYGADYLPIPIAWIDDVRLHIPHTGGKIEPVKDEKGNPLFGINGEMLRDIKCLPRYISSAVEGWRMFFWFTVDKRVRYTDILARLRFRCTDSGGDGPCGVGKDEFIRQLMRRVEHFHEQYGILAPLKEPFDYDDYVVTQADIRAVTKHTRTQLEYGTWWKIDLARDVMRQEGYGSAWLHMLPFKLGISPRVQKILEYCQPRPEPVRPQQPRLRVQKRGIDADQGDVEAVATKRRQVSGGAT